MALRENKPRIRLRNFSVGDKIQLTEAVPPARLFFILGINDQGYYELGRDKEGPWEHLACGSHSADLISKDGTHGKVQSLPKKTYQRNK